MPLGRATNVGLVFHHTLAYYRRALRGVWRYAEGRPHWQLTPLSPRRFIVDLHERFRPSGLVVTANTRQMDRMLQRWDRPAVNVSAVISRQRFPRVGVDNAAVGRLAAAHLRERGLRHFAFVGPARQQFSRERREAYCGAVGEGGCEVHVFSSRQRDFDPLGMHWDLETEVHRWLGQLPKPVGIFAPNDIWGVQVLLACRRAELRIPDQVAVLGVDDDDLFCELTRPALSSIIVPAEQIGYQAGALLERLIAGESLAEQLLLLPPVGVHARTSTDLLAVSDELVAEAMRHIREQSGRPLRVDEVVDRMHVGRRTLERRFQNLLGTGIAAQIRRAQLDVARKLLAQTELSAAVIARRSGFDDYRQMTRIFRRELGLTPTAYREQVSSFRDPD